MMKKDIAFQPGRYTPVVEVSQRTSGIPGPCDSDFTGLEEVSFTTLELSKASARGSGAIVSDPTPDFRLAMIFGSLLACRNIVEQLLFCNVHTRLTSPLRTPRPSVLEPIVRAYNYFGHFELDGKTFVTRGLERSLVRFLFAVAAYATPEVASGTKYTEKVKPTELRDIDLDFYTILPTGEIGFEKVFDLKHSLVRLTSYISTWNSLSVDKKLPVLRDVLDVSTTEGYNHLLRRLRTLPGFDPPTATFTNDPTDKHKAAMKKLFGQEYSSEGDVIPTSRFTGAISNAYLTLRRVSLERSANMKTIEIPKYEGGSASQLANLNDDVLVSEVPLSLADSTAAVAFTTCFGTVARYKSAPGIERDELLRELVSQSFIKM